MDSTQPGKNAVFTFRVGLEKNTFHVDKQVISYASPVLDRMMNSGMKESDINAADLPEVDPFTFLNFLHHAQHLWWSADKTNAQKCNIPYFENGPLVARLLDHGFSHFHCQKCHDKTALAFSSSFPNCRKCQGFSAYMDECEALCIVGYEHDNIIYRVNRLPICVECYQKADLDIQSLRGYSGDADDPGYLNTQIENAEQILIFRFDVPLLALNVSLSLLQTSTYSKDVNAMKQSVNDWKFADMFGIRSLGNAAIVTLFHSLTVSANTGEEVACLTSYIYDETPDSGVGVEFDKKHILRRLISSFIAYHSADLHSSEALREVMCSTREVAMDVWMVMGKIKEGNIGRGW